jgi:hypothetical protein
LLNTKDFGRAYRNVSEYQFSVGASLQWVPVLVSASFQWESVLSFKQGTSAGVMRQLACAVESLALLAFDAKSHPRTRAQTSALPRSACSQHTQSAHKTSNAKDFAFMAYNMHNIFGFDCQRIKGCYDQRAVGHKGWSVTKHSSQGFQGLSQCTQTKVSTLTEVGTRTGVSTHTLNKKDFVFDRFECKIF